MNFFEKIIKIATGTYQNPISTSTAYVASNYFGSTNTNMTKDQLSAFDTQLTSMGLNKPAGIDNLLQDFDQADLDHDGKLTSTEVQAYLVSKGFLNSTASATSTTSVNNSKNLLLNVLSSLAAMQGNNSKFY
jgi:hypothetical protein